LNPQWFAWSPGNGQIERIEDQPRFLERAGFEMLSHPAIVVDQTLAALHYPLSCALPALAFGLLCEKTFPPDLDLRFIPLKLFQVNRLGRLGDCPALFLPVTSP
jgi:hypothetical protein